MKASMDGSGPTYDSSRVFSLVPLSKAAYLGRLALILQMRGHRNTYYPYQSCLGRLALILQMRGHRNTYLRWFADDLNAIVTNFAEFSATKRTKRRRFY